MRIRLLVLGLLTTACALGAYTYDYSYSPAYTAGWTLNGSVDAVYPAATRFYSGGSLIYPNTVSGPNSTDYELKTTLSVQSAGATFVHYLRASTTGLASSGSCAGSYYSVEIAFPSGTYYNPGTAQIYIRQCASGTLSTLASTSAAVWDGAVLRSVAFGTNLWVYLDGLCIFRQAISATTGQPGIGGYGMTAGGFSSVSIGPHDIYAPNTVIATGVRSSVLPTSVSLTWQGATDDTSTGGGIGVYGYKVLRDGTNMGLSLSASFGDQALSPSTTYTYTISAVDYHGNVGSAASYAVTTPPSTAVDPRRVGLSPVGSYWGGGGEQIDTLSGNLNFSLPLVKPQGRTGWTLPVGIAYNSQNWRQDSSTNWELGDDVGYGFGWKLQIGSITPYYKGWPNGVDHYVFADSSGLEYRLDQQNGTVWSSTQGIYIWFDSNTYMLHFKDGTFWRMGAISGGAEQDAGTLYPTIIEDINGNQVIVTYGGAPSLPTGTNTSARIAYIQDVRAVNIGSSYAPLYATYGFLYLTLHTGDPFPHLAQVYNYIGTPESYQMSYASGALSPPFGSDSSYSGVTTNRLTGMTVPVIGTYSLTYDSAGASELAQVTLPWGGHFRWSYSTANYSGSRAFREITNRYLAADSAGATEWTYPFTHSDSGTTITTVHADTTLADPSGVGSKTWFFATSGSGWQIGLATQFVQKASVSGTVLTRDTYTWGQNASGNPYMATKVSVSDETSSNPAATKVTQTLDTYGNATQIVTYPISNSTTPATTPMNTYNNTYLSGSAYTAAYVLNRLLTSTLTTGGATKTLAQNYYDGAPQSGQPTPAYACTGGWHSTAGATLEFDSYAPVAWGTRGTLYETVNPAKSYCFARDGYGNQTTITGSDGTNTTVTPSSATNYAAPGTVATASYNESIAYNSWLGATQTTGANGEQMYMSYDSYGRPAAAISPYGSYGTPTVTYTYSFAGAIPAWQSKTGPDGNTNTVLDGLGRPIEVDRGSVSSTKTVYAPCACSPLGKLQKTSQPYAYGGSPSAWTTYTYDGIGRTLSVQQPDGASTTTYLYTGNNTKVTDPAGNWSQFTSDVSGNLTLVVEPDPASVSGGTLSTYYAYDWMNHLSCSDMTRGGTAATVYTYTSGGVTCITGYTGGTRQTRTFVYNDAGQLTSATNPESGTVTYAYNTDGTLLNMVDAKGQKAAYTYDSSKRMTMLQRYPTISGAEDICQRVTYTYGTDASVYNYGRLLSKAYGSMSGPYYDSDGLSGSCIPGAHAMSFLESYTYHLAGGVTSKTLAVTRTALDDDGSPVTATASTKVSYAYLGTGQVATTTYQRGGNYWDWWAPDTFTYYHDGMGRLSGLGEHSGDGIDTTWVSGVTYDVAGRMTGMQRYSFTGENCDDTPLDNMLTETDGYNVMGQLTSRHFSSYPGGCSPPPSFSFGLTYSYSSTQNNGQITQMSDTISGETVNYLYDSLKRLTSASATPISGSTPAAWTQTFGYDGFGNMTSKVQNGGSNIAPAVDATTNRLTSSYDANGNMLTGAGLTLGYDEANRLTSATPTSGGTERYGYAPDNKRVFKRTAAGGESFTFYGGLGEKLGTYGWADVMGTGDCASGCLLLAGATNVWFGGRLISDGSPTYEDRLGSNRATSATPYPYGENVPQFATYTQDWSALDYADQRYYASSYGRFNTPDPYTASVGPADPASWNRYSYTRGDPINRFDPRGLEDEDPDSPDEPAPVGVRRPPPPKKPEPTSDFPECNPGGNATTEKKLNFIDDNFADALKAANSIEQSSPGSQVSATALATMFLQWSIGESGYPGDNAQVTAENNWFGFQNAGVGGWSGLETACPKTSAIPGNSTNACFSTSTSWGQELGAALSTVSSKTGVAYAQALETALAGGAGSTAAALQAIANNGWNGSSTYGSNKTSQISIAPQVNCLQKNGYIP